MKRIIHLGCSFAVGNGIPHYIQDLPDNIAPSVHNPIKDYVKRAIKDFKIEVKDQITCGSWLANRLHLKFRNYGQNGQSNEATFRKLLDLDLRSKQQKLINQRPKAIGKVVLDDRNTM